MKIWQYKTPPAIPHAEKLASILEISPLLLHLLWLRGHTSPDAINRYLDARLNGLTHPQKWPLVQQAAQIFCDRLLKGKKVAVWGDYDVDGITATTLVLEVLEAHGFDNILYYLPERIKEGYGMNTAGIDVLAEKGCELILTVDCGITNNEAIEYAKEKGIEVIVTDHHLPSENLPGAIAVVDPRMESAGDWPSTHLAGVGVAFYFMAAVNLVLEKHTHQKFPMDKVLDLVALGTLADIMTLDDENRILVKNGLKQLSQTGRKGINALKTVNKINLSAVMDSRQVGFRLAPCLNAAGRMGNPYLALELLRAQDDDKALFLAEQLKAMNDQRKEEEASTLEKARSQAKKLLKKNNGPGLVLAGKGWHPGTVGIVASKIVDEFQCPAIILYEDEGDLKGSGRTFQEFDLFKGLSESAQYLKNFGGHKQAAGVRLAKKNLNEFRKAFSAAVMAQKDTMNAKPVLMLDCELDFKRASSKDFLNELQLMEPYGPGNDEPVFLSPALIVKSRSAFGDNKQHVRLSLEDTTSGTVINSVAWRMAKEFPDEIVDRQILVAYSPRVDTYRGNPVIDIEIKAWSKI